MDVETEEALREELRTLRELNRVKPGDSLTRFDPPLGLGAVFAAARRTISGSLVGYELHLDGILNGRRVLLVGDVTDYGAGSAYVSTSESFEVLFVVAARKAWLG